MKFLSLKIQFIFNIILVCFFYTVSASTFPKNETEPVPQPSIILFDIAHESSSQKEEKHQNIPKSPNTLKDSEKEEACQYFLKTELENDMSKSDMGYTHGHLTSLTRKCPDGEDWTLSFNSRFFTEDYYSIFSYNPDDRSETYIDVLKFQEENELSLEYTNWRAFKEIYYAGGLSIGIISDDKRYISGKEHEIFHDHFKGTNKVIETRHCPGEYNPAHIRLCRVDGRSYQDARVGDYEYHNGTEGNQLFGSGHIALGKSFSLNSTDSINGGGSLNFFRIELGAEIHSMDHASSAFLESEFAHLLLTKHLKDHVYLIANVRGKKGEGSRNWANSSSLGLHVKILPGLKIHYTVKKRDLPEKPAPIYLDSDDDDILHSIGIEIQL